MSDWNTTEGWNSGLNGAVGGAQAGLSVGGPIGAVVGGITGGLTGLFGHKKQTDWNKKYFNESVRQFNVQDEYNKNQMQYRVKDAIKAGVNPIAALGGSGGHYSPTISAGGVSDGDNEQSSNFGSAMSRMADMITARREQKQNRAIELESANLDLESKRLQNDILRNKLLADSQPGIPLYGQTPSKGWRVPMALDATIYDGSYPSMSKLKTPTGDMDVPSEDAADRLDLDFGIVNPLAWEWWLRTKAHNWFYVPYKNWRSESSKMHRRRESMSRRDFYKLLAERGVYGY